LSVARGAHASGKQQIRVALVGAGGRGTGAALNALASKPNVKLIAAADAFRDRLDGSLKRLAAQFPDQVDVPEDRRFADLEGYHKAIAIDGVDLVILASPPAFRPAQFEAAVKAGKHVFMEKPVAVDAPGVRRVLTANEEAKKKGLAVAVGLHLRHEARFQEIVKRLHDGVIGAIAYLRAYEMVHATWTRPRRPGQTEMQYQVHNWWNFNWLSGDIIVQRGVHYMDIANWIMQGHPVRAQGVGGRRAGVGKDHGDIFDHHAVEFEYADGARLFGWWREVPNTWTPFSHNVHGAKGRVEIQAFGNGTLCLDGQPPQVFSRHDRKLKVNAFTGWQAEMDDLVEAIASGRPYNEGDYGATSTMTSILGRMAAYSGQVVEWDQAIQSNLDLVPQPLTWDTIPGPKPGPDGDYPCAIPGVTKAC
jgi:predicted dehydrogenase